MEASCISLIKYYWHHIVCFSYPASIFGGAQSLFQRSGVNCTDALCSNAGATISPKHQVSEMQRTLVVVFSQIANWIGEGQRYPVSEELPEMWIYGLGRHTTNQSCAPAFQAGRMCVTRAPLISTLSRKSNPKSTRAKKSAITPWAITLETR